MTAPANKCERCESMQREAIDGFGMLLELNAQECDASGADREARYLRILRTKMKERGYFTAAADRAERLRAALENARSDLKSWGLIALDLGHPADSRKILDADLAKIDAALAETAGGA